MEGRLLLSPSPAPAHNRAVLELAVVLHGALPQGLQVIHDIDVNLHLAPADAPGTARRPDLVVVWSEALLRVEREGGVLRDALR